MPSTLTTPKPMSFVPEDTKYKQYQGQIDPGFGPGPIGSKPPATVESKKAADARIIAMKEAEAMANKAIAGKGVQNPTVTPAAPPKGYVDDLDFLKKITSNQPRNTSGSTPNITPYDPMETNTIPKSTSKPVQNNTRAPYPDLTMKKGGSFKTTKMSTHEKNPKHKNCW
jgi:hypothetical protein